MWLQTDDAFHIGKGKYHPDGSDDEMEGYGYVDHVDSFVRFFYADNVMLYHEFLKYKVPTIAGSKLIPAYGLSMSKRLNKVTETMTALGKKEDSLYHADLKNLIAYRKATLDISAKIRAMEALTVGVEAPTYTAYGSGWAVSEDGPSYAARVYKEMLANLNIHDAEALFPSAGVAAGSPVGGPLFPPPQSKPVTASLVSEASAPSKDKPPPVGAAPDVSLAPAASKKKLEARADLSIKAPSSPFVPAPSVRIPPTMVRPSLDDIFRTLAESNNSTPKDKDIK